MLSQAPWASRPSWETQRAPWQAAPGWARWGASLGGMGVGIQKEEEEMGEKGGEGELQGSEQWQAAEFTKLTGP